MRFLIFFVIIVGFMDNFVQLPIIAPYAQSLGGDPFWIGLVVSLYSLSNMAGNVLAGWWIDKGGRKRVMLFGLVVAALSLTFYTWVPTVQMLALVRFFHGLGGGFLVPAAYAFLSDRTKEEGRGRAMAFSGAAIGLAAILGPAYGGVLGQRLGLDWVFLSIAGLLLVTACLVTFVLVDPFPAGQRKEEKKLKFGQLLGNMSLFPAYLGAFSLMFGVGILTYALPLKVEGLGFGSSVTGMLMSVYGLVAIILFLLPYNRLSDRVGRLKPMGFGLLILAIGLIGLSVSEVYWSLLTSMVIFGTGFATLFPAMTALLVDRTGPFERGQAFGLFYAFFSLGVVIGPFLVGILSLTYNQCFRLAAGVLACAAFLLGAFRTSFQTGQVERE